MSKAPNLQKKYIEFKKEADVCKNDNIVYFKKIKKEYKKLSKLYNNYKKLG